MGIKIASTWGTPTAAGAGDRLAAEISPNFNVSELVARGIGSGLLMASDVTRGNFIPTFDLVGDFGYRNGWDRIFACLFGTSAVPTEVTVGQSDYKHTLTLNSTLNPKFLMLAYETSSTTTLEAPTCAVQSIGLRTTSVPGYLEASASLLAGTVNLSSVTNTNATLQATTFTEGDPVLAAVNQDDYLWIDDQSTGALASGDAYSITSFDFSLSRPQEIRPEMKGSAGNGAPVSTGRVEGEFTITVKELADHTYYTVWSAETAKKVLVSVEGAQIGSGTNKGIKLYIPRVKMVNEPGYSPTDEGTNPLTLGWKLLGASAAPTGMTSRYPYLEITNTLATSLLA